MPLENSGSQSTDWFSDDDSEFLEALKTTVLPGDAPHQHSSAPHVDLSEEEEDIPFPGSTQPGLKRKWNDMDEPESRTDVVDTAVYGAAHFGNFGEYMNRKRAKLQIQNNDIDHGVKKIFEGLAIYVSTAFFLAT